jgi:hypothetical protein
MVLRTRISYLAGLRAAKASVCFFIIWLVTSGDDAADELQVDDECLVSCKNGGRVRRRQLRVQQPQIAQLDAQLMHDRVFVRLAMTTRPPVNPIAPCVASPVFWTDSSILEPRCTSGLLLEGIN